jgi:Phytanoyl-CoA dioxygenase (PhyH)
VVHSFDTLWNNNAGMHLMAPSAELTDSKALLGDWASLRARIGVDGYVFMRGLLEPETVLSVGRSALGCLQAAGWTERQEDPLLAPPRTPIRAIRMRDAFADAGYRQILTDPNFNKIPFVGPLPDLMGQILGPLGFCYPLKFPRIVYPASMVPRQPGNVIHKDYRSVQDMFTTWLPLVPIPRSLGGLAVQPGSQHSTRVRFRPLNRLERGWVTTDYEPGDVLVFHCLTTHAALPNQQQRMRISAEYRWQLADQPAPRRVTIGPQGHEIGSRMFSRTNWWRSVLPELSLFDDGGDEGTPPVLPPAPSRFVSF